MIAFIFSGTKKNGLNDAQRLCSFEIQYQLTGKKLEINRKSGVTEMKKIPLILFSMLFTIQIAMGQQKGTYDAFMVLQTSADANGMGNIGASLPSYNATATIFNPAQLGIFSLDRFANASTYVTKTPYYPGLGITLSSSAVNIGINSARFLDLPFRCSIGIGYSDLTLNFGAIPITTEDNPDGTGASYSPREREDNYTIAGAFDWYVRFGIGYSFRNFNESVLTESAKANAHDYGAMLQIPAIALASRFTQRPIELVPGYQPILNLNVGYSRRNIGSYTSIPSFPDPEPAQTYSNVSQVLLPRTATLGMNMEFGVETTVQDKEWSLLSITWAREAEGLLIAENYTYKSGNGDLQPFDNLILGKSDGNVSLRKGWQVQIADFFFIRGGNAEEIGYAFNTFGMSFQMSGLIKTLAAINIVDINNGSLAFVLDHIDLQYHYSEYTNSDDAAMDGTTFKALNLVIK